MMTRPLCCGKVTHFEVPPTTCTRRRHKLRISRVRNAARSLASPSLRREFAVADGDWFDCRNVGFETESLHTGRHPGVAEISERPAVSARLAS
jgi:hypothetical protein